MTETKAIEFLLVCLVPLGMILAGFTLIRWWKRNNR